MSTTTAIAIYFLIWWITLFVVLPWGVKSQQESGEFAQGTDPGAPVIARVAMKLLWTTIVASVFFAGCYLAYTRRLVTLDDLATLFGLLR
jgi:predicted secreted protein